jgi:hypothetical protein
MIEVDFLIAVRPFILPPPPDDSWNVKMSFVPV